MRAENYDLFPVGMSILFGLSDPIELHGVSIF